jgi:hypothetical protein
MDRSDSKEERRADDIYLWAMSVVLALVCFGFLACYLILSKGAFVVDINVLVLLFAGIGLLFLPCLSKLKVGGVLEIERLQADVKEVKRLILRGEVVRTSVGGRFYIDDQANRYSMPDDETARFLRSSGGELQVSDQDLAPYLFVGQMDSVLSCDILHWDGHVFVLLNDKKYHVGSASHLADWGRSKNEYRTCSSDQISRYPTGR